MNDCRSRCSWTTPVRVRHVAPFKKQSCLCMRHCLVGGSYAMGICFHVPAVRTADADSPAKVLLGRMKHDLDRTSPLAREIDDCGRDEPGTMSMRWRSHPSQCVKMAFPHLLHWLSSPAQAALKDRSDNAPVQPCMLNKLIAWLTCAGCRPAEALHRGLESRSGVWSQEWVLGSHQSTSGTCSTVNRSGETTRALA